MKPWLKSLQTWLADDRLTVKPDTTVTSTTYSRGAPIVTREDFTLLAHCLRARITNPTLRQFGDLHNVDL